MADTRSRWQDKNLPKAKLIISVCVLFIALVLILDSISCWGGKSRDKDPPYTSDYDPTPGTTCVPVTTSIVVHVKDDKSGVVDTSIVMKVNSAVVNPRINGGQDDYTLTYGPSNFVPGQVVDVTLYAKDYKSNIMQESYSFEIETTPGCSYSPPPDEDGDGIPDDMEKPTFLGTNPSVKTLFVRPMKQKPGVFPPEYLPWADDFITLFRGTIPAGVQVPNGFAYIPAFAEAGIEVSVIGSGNHPYPPMKESSYDPAVDDKHPACDILEVVIKPDTPYCSDGHHNYGHTYFSDYALTWYWDTKGYTPNNRYTQHYLTYKYLTPQIYLYPLENYFTEGAYMSIEVGQSPKVPNPCPISPINQCYDYSHSSPMNVNQADWANQKYDGPPDGTVEFNEITFDETAMITSVGAIGIPYDQDAVLRRTIMHEMGHAILDSLTDDHCQDPNCIMYIGVLDWEEHIFGPGQCTHRPGGSLDIRADGIIHNSVHP